MLTVRTDIVDVMTISPLLLAPIPDVVEARTDRYGDPLPYWDHACEKAYRSAATARVPALPAAMLIASRSVVPARLYAPGAPGRRWEYLATLAGALDHSLVLSGQARLDLGQDPAVQVWAAARLAVAPQVLLDLARSRHLSVRAALARSRQLPGPVAAVLAQDANPEVRRAVRENPTVAAEWQVLAALFV